MRKPVNFFLLISNEPFSANNECGDVDECADAMHNCPTLSTCANNDGSFTCEAIAGAECTHKMWGSVKTWQCKDIDQCAAGHNCPAGISTCVDALSGKSYRITLHHNLCKISLSLA